MFSFFRCKWWSSHARVRYTHLKAERTKQKETPEVHLAGSVAHEEWKAPAHQLQLSPRQPLTGSFMALIFLICRRWWTRVLPHLLCTKENGAMCENAGRPPSRTLLVFVSQVTWTPLSRAEYESLAQRRGELFELLCPLTSDRKEETGAWVYFSHHVRGQPRWGSEAACTWSMSVSRSWGSRLKSWPLAGPWSVAIEGFSDRKAFVCGDSYPSWPEMTPLTICCRRCAVGGEASGVVLRHGALGVVRFEPGPTTSLVIPECSFLREKWGQDLFPGKTRLGCCLGDVEEELVEW